MVIEVIAHPKSSRNEIIIKDGNYHAYVTSAPEKNKANKKIIELLSKYMRRPKSKVLMLSGEHSRNKKFEIED